MSSLLGMGWRLIDSGQLSPLVRELADGSPAWTHNPSDHFR
ncbi:MAG TPA: hypothetical protein VLF95_13610 [Vicinamibacteria bacterium]|nr:hypothetical protein [Vicinamibacteria bacterium]